MNLRLIDAATLESVWEGQYPNLTEFLMDAEKITEESCMSPKGEFFLLHMPYEFKPQHKRIASQMALFPTTLLYPRVMITHEHIDTPFAHILPVGV